METPELELIGAFKQFGLLGVSLAMAWMGFKRTMHFLFNEDPRSDGKCKGPFARLINDHVDRMTTIGDTLMVIKDVIKQFGEGHAEVMKLLCMMEQKLERMFVHQTGFSDDYLKGVQTIGLMLMSVGKEIGVDVSEHQRKLEKLVSERKQL